MYIAGVLVLALVMIGILGTISFFSDPKTVKLGEMEDYEGEEVVCKGIAVGVQEEEYSTTIMLYQDGTVAKVYVEERTDKVRVNHRIKARGEVYKSGSSFALQVVGKNSLEVLGEAEPIEAYPGNLGDNIDEYVVLDSVAVGVSKNPWGGGTARVIGIPSIESEGNWSANCRIEFSDCPKDLNSTDRVTAYGVVREGKDEAYLYVYDPEAVRIEKDYWEPKNLTLGMLSEVIERGSDEFSGFTVRVSGYLKYEPGEYASLTLTDHPTQGEYTLKVITRDMECDYEMSKGDLLYVQGTMDYDREDMRYVLNTQWVEVGEVYGIWELTLKELSTNYYLYENARVLVSGQLSLVDDVLYLIDGESKIRTNANPNDWNLGVEMQIYGWLRFDNEELYYYLDMSEP